MLLIVYPSMVGALSREMIEKRLKRATVLPIGSTKLVAEAFSDDGGKVVTMCKYSPLLPVIGVFSNGPPLVPVTRTSLEPFSQVEPVHMFIYASLEKLNKADYEHLSEW